LPAPSSPRDRRSGQGQALVRLPPVRCRSLVKNVLQLQLLALAMNLRRALALTG
jgi:hypothetical protein